MVAHLVRGDARRLPLATGSVQCVVTSPPYFGLRSYGGQTSVWGGDPDCPHEWGCNAPPRSKNGSVQTFNSSKMHPASLAARSPFAVAETAIGGATCTRCGAWRGELGSEPTPALFVAHLVEVFRECWRVLRDDGCLFLNMGDSYAGSWGNQGRKAERGTQRPINGPILQSLKGQYPAQASGTGTLAPGLRPKSLLLVPERLAIALSDDGWVIRSRIAWAKLAPMPESVDDRPTSAWEHIWQLTKSNKALFWTHRDGPGQRTQPAPDYRWRKDGVELTEEPEDAKENGWKRVNLWRGHDYYWDADAVREERAEPGRATDGFRTGGAYINQRGVQDNSTRNNEYSSNGNTPDGANMRNFWLLGPDPYPMAHYATFVREIPRRCILAATSEYGACAECGAAYRRDIARTTRYVGKAHDAKYESAAYLDHYGSKQAAQINGDLPSAQRTTTGWVASCKCGPAAGVRPCVVLDIFSGSGTTAYQAARMGRIGVGVELSEAYIKQAQNGRLAQGFLPLAAPEPTALRLPFEAEVPG